MHVYSAALMIHVHSNKSTAALDKNIVLISLVLVIINPTSGGIVV